MPLPVSLAEVADELQMINDTAAAYLNRVTGETYTVLDDEVAFSEVGDDSGLPEWQREEGARIREVLASDDWLALPSQFEIHPYAIMEAFCLSIPPDEGGEWMVRAVRGRGAFRRFRDEADRLDLTERWYAHRDQAYRRIAARWLDDHEIPHDDAGT